MATIVFTQNLRRHVDVERCEVSGETVAEALEDVFANHPQLRGYLLDDCGAIRKHVAITLNGETILDRDKLSDPLPAGGEIFVMQALSGG
mgnify:FL=1